MVLWISPMSTTSRGIFLLNDFFLGLKVKRENIGWTSIHHNCTINVHNLYRYYILIYTSINVVCIRVHWHIKYLISFYGALWQLSIVVVNNGKWILTEWTTRFPVIHFNLTHYINKAENLEQCCNITRCTYLLRHPCGLCNTMNKTCQASIHVLSQQLYTLPLVIII